MHSKTTLLNSSWGSIVANKQYEFVTYTVNRQNISDYPIWIFGRNNDHGGYLFANGLRMHNFTLIADDITVRDFVIVRFTNELGVSEGAMFDKVTKKLFRNSGTGSFVIGPDVA